MRCSDHRRRPHRLGPGETGFPGGTYRQVPMSKPQAPRLMANYMSISTKPISWPSFPWPETVVRV
jgi:hypothetical protein